MSTLHMVKIRKALLEAERARRHDDLLRLTDEEVLAQLATQPPELVAFLQSPEGKQAKHAMDALHCAGATEEECLQSVRHAVTRWATREQGSPAR